MAVPTSIKQLYGLLGLIGFYRRFIRSYASISFCLTELLMRDPFKWNTNAQQAFAALKTTMTHALVLPLPDFTQ